MNRFLHPFVEILFALFGSAAMAFAGASEYGTQPVDNPEITAERLDRAVDFILSQDPPFITHGSRYGDCPFWSGGDPNVFVICTGFWTGLDRKSFAASLLNEGWKAGSGQSPKSIPVEYGDKRFPGSYSAPEKTKRPSP